MTKLIALAAALVLSSGIAFADTTSTTTLAPSAIVGSASTYDKQTVTVSGTVKGVTTEQGPRGPMTRYQVCDSQCVNVVQFEGNAPAEGSSQTVTGRFRTSVSHGNFQATNIIMVRPAGWHPHK